MKQTVFLFICLICVTGLHAADSPTDGGRHINIRYASMTEELDIGLGRILDKLEELDLDENTYVICNSENGAEITEGTYTSNEPLA